MHTISYCLKCNSVMTTYTEEAFGCTVLRRVCPNCYNTISATVSNSNKIEVIENNLEDMIKVGDDK